jgi:hypothetical protein
MRALARHHGTSAGKCWRRSGYGTREGEAKTTLELHNASLNYTGIPSGITNANGIVLFNRSSGSVQSLTAELGGGKLPVGGFVAYNELIRFGLRATAANVRIRLQQGVGAMADVNIQLTGGTQASLVSGTVTIDQVTYAPTSDFGSILSRAAPAVQSPTAPSPLLDNMKLDIQLRTSSSLAVQASMNPESPGRCQSANSRNTFASRSARPGVHHRRPACLFQLDVHGQFEELELSSTWVDQLQSPLREGSSARTTCGRARFRSVLTSFAAC